MEKVVIGNAELWHGDCLEVMRSFSDACIDLTVTSPPYDNLRQYKGYSFDFENIARELFRVTKYGGVVVWVVADATVDGSESGTSFRQALFFKEIGFNLHDTMIYHKEGMPLSHNRYEQHFEYMFVFTKGKPHTFQPIMERAKRAGESLKSSTRRHTGTETSPLHGKGEVKEWKVKGNVWFYEIGYAKSTLDKDAFEHPAIFPEKLAQDHILSWSNKGDTVFDCFTGSGTTGKMAVKEDRRFIGCEISKEYFDIACERIERAQQQLKLAL